MKLRQWLENTASQLSDFVPDNSAQQFVHWSQELLLSYFNDARCYIASLKPNDFISQKIMKLQPGVTQVSCCPVVGTITEFVDSNGRFISPILSTKKPMTWRGGITCQDRQYVPYNAYRVDASPSMFEISPPVPEVGSYYVKIRCSSPPDDMTLNDLDTEIDKCKYSAAITEWALYRALSGDTDTAMSGLAQLHYKAFTDIIGTQNKVEAAFMKELK